MAATGAAARADLRPAERIEATGGTAAPTSMRALFLGNDLPVLIAAGKAEYRAIRERAHARSGRIPGDKAARLMAQELDLLVHGVHLFFRRQARSKGVTISRHSHALLALGSYGRAQLHAYSDVDLMVLLRDDNDPGVRDLISDFFKALWDMGMELGAVVRTTADCLAFLGKDFKTATSLLDIRRLAGSARLPEQLTTQVQLRLGPNGNAHKWFREALGEAARQRWAEHGGSEFVLEPNVKDGIGALRDYHDLLWWLHTCRPYRSLRQLHDARVISSADFQRLNDGYNFLMTLRAHIHRLAGRKVDSLIFDYHRPVAQAMRFRERDGQLAEEQLMREYYINAHRLRYISTRIKRELSAERRDTLMGRMVGRITERRVAPYFVMRAGKLLLDEQRLEDWRSDEEGVMRVFLKLAQLEAALSGRLIERIQAEVERVDSERFRTNAYNRDAFLKIIGDARHGSRCLRLMHECGVLDLYIPEFAHLFCLVRADHYHKYTVDEHTFKALEAAEALLRPNHPDEHVARVARRIMRWPIFMLSLLFHDIGKGKGHGHVVRGAQMVGAISTRMDLPSEDGELIHFLVVQHLKMSHLALRRDLSDPRVARELASVVENRERLDALYVLTYCDINAVAPGMWNNWKASLLRELYEKTVQVLETGQVREQDIFDLPADLPARVQQFLPAEKYPPSQVKRFLDGLPHRYLHYTTPECVAAHFRLLRSRSPEEPVTWELIHQVEFDRSLLVVCAPDVPGLFHVLTRALASKRISITSAIAFSSTDGVVVDEFGLTLDGKALPAGFRLERLRHTICMILRGETTLEEAFGAATLAPVDAPRERLVPMQIKVDNDASEQWTVVEVRTHDRPGLLSAISGVFVENGINIQRAIINTEAYGVVDVFYIATLDNNKLTDRGRVRKLEQALMAKLSGHAPESAQNTPQPPDSPSTGVS